MSLLATPATHLAMPRAVAHSVTPGLAPATIPSPTSGAWHLGPLAVRAYALCILAGIVVAVLVGQRRISVRPGGRPGVVMDVAIWAVPFGIVGGRLYHLITTPQPYFGEGGHPIDALKITNGGLGIWGAVALGAVGAWIACRRHCVSFLDFCDAVAPGVLIAQAMGRFGNYFNNEIHGAPTTLPWRLKVYEWDQAAGHAVRDAAGHPVVKGYFHPTFLYESIFCLVLAGVLVLVGRRWRLHRGQVFAGYVLGYPVGRVIIENMRTDSANIILGQRVNTWVSLLVFLLGLSMWLHFRRTQPLVETGPVEDDDATARPPERLT